MQTLHFEEFGEEGNPVFLCLHGLLGSNRNWRAVAKSLAASHQVYTLDLRNHGNSFHSKECSLAIMSDDLYSWINAQGKRKVILCGHSLGGKVAMRFACDYPERIEKLIVVDIAPRSYPPEHHVPTFDAMLSLNLADLNSRKEADQALSGLVPHWGFRQFLLANLTHDGSNYCWKSNLSILRKSIENLSSNPLQGNDLFVGPALFVRGGKSGYLRSENHSAIKRFFPSAKVEELIDVGHDVHVEDREGFLKIIRKFLNGSEFSS